jgi:hypothetical protein
MLRPVLAIRRRARDGGRYVATGDEKPIVVKEDCYTPAERLDSSRIVSRTTSVT